MVTTAGIVLGLLAYGGHTDRDQQGMWGTRSRVVCGRAARSATTFFCRGPRCHRSMFSAATAIPCTGKSYSLQGRRQLSSAAPRPSGVRRGADAGAAAGRLAREIAQVLQSKGTQLVLHFDVNKTLIMVDPAGRKTQSQVLNSVLSEICWGQVEQSGSDQASAWRWDGCPPSTEPPWRRRKSDKDKGVIPVDPDPVSYSDFLHQEFGDAEGKDNLRMKRIRDAKKGSFTEDGQPGVGLRAEFLKLEQALALPEAVAKSPLTKRAGLADRQSYYIIPSFFRCLIALKEAGTDFGVVFRTFGDDVAKVSREYNAFCEGNHPLLPGPKMDGSDGRGDYRIHLDQAEGSRTRNTIGAFFRDEKGVALVMGTRDNPKDRRELRSIEEKGHSVYRSIADIHDAICERVLSAPLRGFSPVDQVTSASPNSASPAAPTSELASVQTNCVAEKGSRNVPGRCLALRDFYPFWRENLEAATAGKLLPVDLSKSPKVWSIMFDDNIGREDSSLGAHIVDIRAVASGQPVPFDTALERHIVRAEPFLAIDLGQGDAGAASASDENFFLTNILKRLAPERARRYSAREDGGIGSACNPQP